MEESAASKCEDTLFCFQTKFMRNTLKKYGGSVVCPDTTHKTSDYTLPLFLLVVKTPSGYTSAGIFIVQFETAHCIAVALDVFKQWCDKWSPQYWMVDYSKAEISATSKCFQRVKSPSVTSIDYRHGKDGYAERKTTYPIQIRP